MSLQKGRSSCSVHNGLERGKLQAVRLLRKLLLEGTVGSGRWREMNRFERGESSRNTGNL